MRTRNALMLIAASIMTAVTAGAQQPAKAGTTRSVTPTPASHATATPTTRTAAAPTLPVNADSARRIVSANAAGATITSTHLRRTGDRAYYAVTYHLKGSKKAQHATVDARTGAFIRSVATPKPASRKAS